MRLKQCKKRLTDLRGFSLAELVIGIVVFGILAAIAVPQFLAFRPKNRLNGAARQVYSELMWARSKAVNDNASAGSTPEQVLENFNSASTSEEANKYLIGRLKAQLAGLSGETKEKVLG